MSNLSLLIDSCRSSDTLSPRGWDVLAKVAVRHLRNRLSLQEEIKANPGAGLGPDRAVVVTGLPRTGTTLLQELLACDGQNRVLRFWEAIRPAPVARSPEETANRIDQAERWLDRFYLLAPEFRAIHHRTAEGPEECDVLLQNSFASQHLDDMFDAPAYSAWLATAALTREYEDFAVQLGLLGATGPRRWVLKSPSHLGHLDALLHVLPGALVVQCHRDPLEAVGSYASLILALRRAYSDKVDPARVGQQALARTAVALQRASQRRREGGDFFDVDYAKLVQAPLEVVGDIYKRLDRPLSSQHLAAMEGWLADHPRHRHGEHRYQLDSFGLSAGDLVGLEPG